MEQTIRQSDGSKTETTLSSVDTRGSWPISEPVFTLLYTSPKIKKSILIAKPKTHILSKSLYPNSKVTKFAN